MAEHRLPKKSHQEMSSVLAAPRLRQNLSAQLGQPFIQALDLSEQGLRYGDLGELKSYVATMAPDLRAEFHQLLAQRGQLPLFHRLGKGELAIR